MKISKLISALTVVSFSLAANAKEEVAYAVPIEWQKVELQEKIAGDLTRAVGAVIDPSKFLVTVNVSVSAAKEFGVGGKKAGNEAFPLDKLGINKNSKAYKKAIRVSADSVFSRISRVAVDLNIDTNVTPAQEASARTLATNVVRSYVRGRPAIKINRMAFINDDFSRSRNLEVARVNVEAAEAVAKAIAESNEKIATAINAVQGLASEDGKPVVAKPMPSTWQGILMEFSMPLGIIAATILLILAVGGFKTIEGQKVALMAAANRQAKEASDNAVAAQAAPEPERQADQPMELATAAASMGESNEADSGFNQFRKMAEQFPESAAYFVKLWLNLDTMAARETIAMLPKRVPVDVLVPVISKLDDALKNKLKRASSINVDAGSAARAESFIISQLVDTYLVNTIELTEEVRTTLAGMTLNEYSECLGRDSRLGVVFMNVLPSSQIGRLLALVSDDQISEMFENGLKFTQDDLNYMGEVLPGILADLRQNQQKIRVPLLDKSMDLIGLLGPDKENEVFDMLISAGDTEQVMEATKRFYPAELIMTLGPEHLRTMLSRLRPRDRAALIHTRPDEQKELLLEAVGDTGRLRDIIDSELGEITGNESLKNQVEKDQGKIWSQFINSSRTTISADDRIKEVAEESLKQWLVDKGVDFSDEEDMAA